MSNLLGARRRAVLVGSKLGGGGGGGDANVVHTIDAETGDLSQIEGPSVSGGGEWGVATAPEPVHSGTYSIYAKLVNSSAGDGIRFRIDNNVEGSQSAAFGGAGWNLPKDMYCSIWVHIPQYIDLGGDDPWNIFQFKQHVGWPDGARTMKLLDSLTLRDRGAGNPYGLTFKSIIHDDGSWSHNNKPTWTYLDPLVPVGQWTHIEWHRIWSTDPAVGKNQVRINDVLVHDVTRKTYMTIATDPNNSHAWDDFNPERRFQWTFNSYHTGGSGVNHNPNTHTLYFDDGYLAMNDWVGTDGP